MNPSHQFQPSRKLGDPPLDRELPASGQGQGDPVQAPEVKAGDDQGQWAHWLEEKSEALKFRLGESFAVPPTALIAPSVHLETGEQVIQEVLLEHEAASPELLAELAALKTAPPLPDEDLEEQALRDGGADKDASTPE